MTSGEKGNMNQATNGILQTSLFNFDAAAERLGLENEIREKIRVPKEKIEIRINPVLPDGKMVFANIFIVIHSDALGPAKGGIRMTPEVTLDDITGLSMEMTWKTSVMGVPFGGGKSGIQFDPRTLEPMAKETIIRAFTRGARRHLGPEIYVPAPDMGTNQIDMAHIRDCISYSEGRAITNGCFVTGKPIIFGGIAGRREATGKGVVFTVLALCDKLGRDIKKTRVAVQGFGNVGSVTALEIAKHGAQVVAVADIFGAVHNPDGLDIPRLLEHSEATGSLADFPGARRISGEEFFAVDCDIIIPAAAESQITHKNAGDIKAKIIAEGANAPTTPQGDDILRERNIFVIPDILCNAGGVFVSYLEYTQETQREQMTTEQVETRLANQMRMRFDAIYEVARKKGQEMREAAMDMALQRVVEAVFARGLLP